METKTTFDNGMREPSFPTRKLILTARFKPVSCNPERREIVLEIPVGGDTPIISPEAAELLDLSPSEYRKAEELVLRLIAIEPQ